MHDKKICFCNELFFQVSECLDDSLYIITHVIENIMDFEASTEQGRFIVKEGAVTELDESNYMKIVWLFFHSSLHNFPILF